MFEPFLRDVEHARELPPLTAQALRASPFGASFDLLLTSRDRQSSAIVTFSGVTDPAALHELVAVSGPDMVLLDLKGASESLVALQRTRLLWSLAVAAVLLVVVVSVALRRRDRVLRVLAPMALTTLLLIAALHGAGVALNLFHLIALILAAGLGLDYALFFEHAADDPHEQRRTLHAVLICSLSTLMVFALLATSGLPVLRAIGLTVTLGVVSNFVLALLLTRDARLTGQPANRQLARVGTIPSCDFRPAASWPVSQLATLIPHQGSMCLLERVVEWNDHTIRLETDTHRSPTNPLRSEGELKAIHLCEYGAQAMAVHGALKAQVGGTTAAAGMLVSLREVTFHCERIDTLTGTLTIEADCLQATASSQQYAFRVLHLDALLCEGRVAVMLGQ